MTSAVPFEHRSADEFVGEQINTLMWRAKMTRRELADEVLGTDPSTVSKKLRGERSWTIDEILVVARHFGVAPSDLLPGNDYDPVLSGRGRGVVRHQGLEPRTR